MTGGLFFRNICLLLSIHLVSAQQQKPNIVLIVVDDLGYADMGFLDQAPADVKNVGTPGFNQLAKSSTYFTNGYSTSPICSPSRAGLLTGRYQQRWGNYSYNEGGLPLNELTIPEALLQAGYSTAKIGKTHLNGGPKKYPSQHGFESSLGFQFHTWDYIRLSKKDVAAYKSRSGFKGKFGVQVVGPLLKSTALHTKPEDYEKVSYEDGFTTRIFTEAAVEFIKASKQKPFYLHLSYNAVHMPTYVTDKQWTDKVGLPHVPWDRNAVQWDYPYWEPNKETHQVFHKKWGHMGEIDKNGRRAYLSNLLALDDGIAQLLAALEESGQRKNTIIFFISDNGGTINTYANNSPLNGYKYMMGEGGIRIPFIVSMPGTLPQNKTNDKAVVSTMDIFPTILELAGVSAPNNLDGKSLISVLKKNKINHHKHLVWALNPNKWVVRKGKWKLTNNAGWKHNHFVLNDNGDVAKAARDYRYPNEPQLFDLENDLGETTNLLTTYPRVASSLRKLYENWNQQMPGPLTPQGKPKY